MYLDFKILESESESKKRVLSQYLVPTMCTEFLLDSRKHSQSPAAFTCGTKQRPHLTLTNLQAQHIPITQHCIQHKTGSYRSRFVWNKQYQYTDPITQRVTKLTGVYGIILYKIEMFDFPISQRRCLTDHQNKPAVPNSRGVRLKSTIFVQNINIYLVGDEPIANNRARDQSMIEQEYLTNSLGVWICACIYLSLQELQM